MTQIMWIEKYLEEAERMIIDGNVDDGLAILNNLLFEEPGCASLHNHLGWANMYFTQNEAAAELHFKAAIKFDEAFAPPYLHLSALKLRSGRYSEAITYAEKGLTKPKANRVALFECIANAYELRGEYRKAISNYKTALATSLGFESDGLLESIKRCRKKRWALLFDKASRIDGAERLFIGVVLYQLFKLLK